MARNPYQINAAQQQLLLLQQQQLLAASGAQSLLAANPALGLQLGQQGLAGLNPNTPLLNPQQQLALSAQLQAAQQQVLLQNQGRPNPGLLPNHVRKSQLIRLGWT